MTMHYRWTKRRYDISGTLVTDLNALAQALEAAAADARYLAAALEASRASGPHVTQSDANKEGECSEAVVLAAEKVIGASKEIR